MTEAPRKHLAARAPLAEDAPSLTPVHAKPVLLYVLAISFCAFPLGWDLGTTGNLMDLPSFRVRLGVAAPATGALISVFNIGCICACIVLFMARATRKYGHLVMLRVCLCTLFLGYSLSFGGLVEAPSSIYLYAIGRAIQGLSAGASCVIGPVFIGHLCTFSSNSIVYLALFQIVVAVFVVLGNCVFIYTGVYSELVFSSVSVLVPVVGMACSAWLPESPRDPPIFCDPQRFRKSLGKLLHDSDKEEVWVSAVHILKAHLGENAHAKKRKTDKKRLWACCVLLFLQQMTGASFFFYFGKTMFDTLVVTKSSVKFSGLLLSVCNLGGTLVSGFLVRRTGARKPLFSGSIALSILLFTFASMGVSAKNSAASSLGIPMLVTSCFFLSVFAMSWGPCTAVVSMEISQADERILSCSVICGWATNVVVVSLFPLLVDKLGLGAMYIFLLFTIASVWATRKDYF